MSSINTRIKNYIFLNDLKELKIAIKEAFGNIEMILYIRAIIMFFGFIIILSSVIMIFILKIENHNLYTLTGFGIFISLSSLLMDDIYIKKIKSNKSKKLRNIDHILLEKFLDEDFIKKSFCKEIDSETLGVYVQLAEINPIFKEKLSEIMNLRDGKILVIDYLIFGGNEFKIIAMSEIEDFKEKNKIEAQKDKLKSMVLVKK